MTEGQAHVLPDGRTLCYRIFGPLPQPSIPTVFYFHGSPGSYNEGAPVHDSATKQGIALCIIAVTRPGFGGSTYQPNRTLLSFASDVLSLADELSIQSFAVMGFSGGGPYALACASSLPSTRLVGAVVVSSMYPPDMGREGMLLVNRLFLGLCPWAPGLLGLAVDWYVGSLARDDPDKYARFMVDSFDDSRPPEDRAVARCPDGPPRAFMDALVRSTREGFLQGSRGFADEFALFGSPWGFDLARLNGDGKMKTVIWHGEKDANVPVGLAKKAASLIPDAELKTAKYEAFISLSANRMDDIVVSLLQLFRG